MSKSLLMILSTLMFVGRVTQASSEPIDCTTTALDAGYAFAKLNHAPGVRSLVIQREQDGRSNDEAGLAGRWYMIRDPKGDINFCAVFTVVRDNKCSVYEIIDNTYN